MNTMIVATRNQHKVREIGQIVSEFGFQATGLEKFADYVLPEETGQTFLENARIKAYALKKYLFERFSGTERQNMFILADDSGLECDDLGGAPGISSARFAGPNAGDEENNAKLIESLKQVTHLSRGARYVCSMILICPDGCEEHITATCGGHIVMMPQGRNGFGYDPYFYLEDFNKTMAELSAEEKNGISHRGKALRSLLARSGIPSPVVGGAG